MFLNFFLKTEAGHVIKMFLNFGQIWASRSYNLGSYKKKTCRPISKIEQSSLLENLQNTK